MQSSACFADELDELSFTELLNMDLDADEAGVAPPPPLSEQEPLPGVSSVTRPRSRRGGPGTAPKGSRPPQHSAGVSSQVWLCHSHSHASSSNCCAKTMVLMLQLQCHMSQLVEKGALTSISLSCTSESRAAREHRHKQGWVGSWLVAGGNMLR